MTAALRKRFPIITSLSARWPQRPARCAERSAGRASSSSTTFSVLSVQVGNSTRDLFTTELARNGRTLVALQHESRRQLVLTAAVLAQSPTLKSAIETYRVEQQSGSAPRAILTETVERELARLGEHLRGGTLLVTDEHGRVFASYVRGMTPALRGVDLSTLHAVRNALDASLVTTADDPYLAGLEIGDHYFSVGVAPLIVHDYTVGTIVVGEPVDASDVEALKRNFDADVVIAAGKRIIGSTIADGASAHHDAGPVGHTRWTRTISGLSCPSA